MKLQKKTLIKIVFFALSMATAAYAEDAAETPNLSAPGKIIFTLVTNNPTYATRDHLKVMADLKSIAANRMQVETNLYQYAASYGYRGMESDSHFQQQGKVLSNLEAQNADLDVDFYRQILSLKSRAPHMIRVESIDAWKTNEAELRYLLNNKFSNWDVVAIEWKSKGGIQYGKSNFLYQLWKGSRGSEIFLPNGKSDGHKLVFGIEAMITFAKLSSSTEKLSASPGSLLQRILGRTKQAEEYKTDAHRKEERRDPRLK